MPERECHISSIRRGNCTVVIAGTGIAAAATALRVSSLGFVPQLLSLGRASALGIEAVPEAAFPLITELELDDAVAEAGGKIVEGFENAWMPSAPILRRGRWLQVERSAFAAAAVRQALGRGAEVCTVKTLPPIPTSCLAAVDATGRSAAWSRPVRRHGNQIADIFEVAQIAERGRIERSSDGWTYRIGSTLGVVGPPRRRSAPPAGMRHLGRRPAFPQWCESPIQGRRIAVGDAALAYDPLAGQGIRFALASAFAAASVIQAWYENNPGPATRFYCDFVAQACIHHLEFLEKLSLDEPSKPVISLPKEVRFAGRRVAAELSLDSRIVADQAIALPNGAAVRWLAGFDLLELEKFARSSVASASLHSYLVSAGFNSAQAKAVLLWCLRKGVLKSGASFPRCSADASGCEPLMTTS